MFRFFLRIDLDPRRFMACTCPWIAWTFPFLSLPHLTKECFFHMFKGAGLRYEIGISLKCNQLVWAFGPHPCGAIKDQRIFNSDLQPRLLQDEKKSYVIRNIQRLKCF